MQFFFHIFFLNNFAHSNTTHQQDTHLGHAADVSCRSKVVVVVFVVAAAVVDMLQLQPSVGWQQQPALGMTIEMQLTGQGGN